MSKEMWLIEPRDSLIVRDGKPFSADAGNRADSLQFPFPSTITGAVRTRAGLAKLDGDRSGFYESLTDELQREISVRGPLLAEINEDSADFLFPAPADCIIFQTEEREDVARLVPLLPIDKQGDFVANLDLHLCGLSEFQKGKPHTKAPRFWLWSAFDMWLREPKAQEMNLSELGISGLEKDRRTHVVIDRRTKAAQEGGLFETRGLEFIRRRPDGSGYKRYALALEVNYGNFDARVKEGIAPLGGERRLAFWRKIETTFPPCPEEIKNEVSKRKSCRLILLTPAVFEQGFLPTWLLSVHSVSVEIKAVAVNRYQVISGWDFKLGKPKGTRRVSPAGTVLYLKLDGSEGAIRNWIERVWFSCISDDEQDRKDGFGLAALGVWDGELLRLKEVLK
jgi:CRISPR-associated protein Cmr3